MSKKLKTDTIAALVNAGATNNDALTFVNSCMEVCTITFVYISFKIKKNFISGGGR